MMDDRNPGEVRMSCTRFRQQGSVLTIVSLSSPGAEDCGGSRDLDEDLPETSVSCLKRITKVRSEGCFVPGILLELSHGFGEVLPPLLSAFNKPLFAVAVELVWSCFE